MNFVRTAAIVMGTLFGLFILVGLLLPGQMQVERSVEISTAPEAIFPLVDDLRAFNRWSPWAKDTSNTRYSFEGPEAGVGARMTWSSDDPEVGAGSQEIIRSRQPEQVVFLLDFGPQGSADARFDLEPLDSGPTRVTWSFGYQIGNDLIGRYMGLLMKGLVGDKYEEGLDRLKRLAETGAV
ncbi:MAG: SRPBCC family protein [Pseudomonadota bacterium]|nr:SRPBCC family protein [Pseudomonadota bacterium]